MADETRVDWLEGDTGTISFTLVDEDGAPVAKAALESLTLDLYAVTEPIPATVTSRCVTAGSETFAAETINDRDAQDVLDANDVTMHDTTGVVTWDVQTADVPFVGADRVGAAAQYETHVARFTARWGGSPATEQKTYAIVMRVKNVRRYVVD